MLDEVKRQWTEKYRPDSLDSIILPEKTRDLIEKYVSEGVIPNLFLCSPPGQGKTSLAKMLAKNIFDVDYLYVNASDENDVETVRKKIAEFARTSSLRGDFKIVILDECDNFASTASQKILRGLMEEVSDTTRFILTANYGHRVIDAIKSRCTQLDILPDKAGIAKRLFEIMTRENIALADDEQKRRMGVLINRFYPDVRTIISNLQNSVNKDGVLNLPDYAVSSKFMESILDFILNGKPLELRKYIIENELEFGSNYNLLLHDLFKLVMASDKLEPAKKAKWTIIIADYCSRFGNSIDPELNASACLFSLFED